MKKTVTLLAFLLITTTLVWAGGKSEGQKQKELSVLWFYDDPAELDFLKTAFTQYSAMHPEISFKLNTVAYDDLNPKVTQLVAGGTPPDVVKLTDVRPEYAPFILDLSTYLGKDCLDNFIKGVAVAVNRDGKIIGRPLDVTANGIILNRDLFDQAGIAIPDKEQSWSWEEFARAVVKIRDSTGVKFPLVWDVTPHRWLTFLYENGSSIFTPDGKGNGFNNPNSVAAFKGFLELHTRGVMPLSVWGGTENPRDLFFSGQAVAWMSGSWQVKAMMDNLKAFKWTAGPNPYVTTRSSVLGYKFVSGFATSPYPQEAARFIEWFTSAEMNSRYATTLTVIPARTDVGTIDYGDAQATSALNNLAYELAISPSVASTDVPNPAMSYVWNTLKENVIAVVLEQESPEQAVQIVSKKIDEALNATK